jgi:hypothetical protein
VTARRRIIPLVVLGVVVAALAIGLGWQYLSNRDNDRLTEANLRSAGWEQVTEHLAVNGDPDTLSAKDVFEPLRQAIGYAIAADGSAPDEQTLKDADSWIDKNPGLKDARQAGGLRAWQLAAHGDNLVVYTARDSGQVVLLTYKFGRGPDDDQMQYLAPGPRVTIDHLSDGTLTERFKEASQSFVLGGSLNLQYSEDERYTGLVGWSSLGSPGLPT